MKINVGVSNHHIHLKESDFKLLFNKDSLEVKNMLTQKGQFASTSLLTIKTSKGEISNVRVLGPFRDYTQIEISRTDAYKLRIEPPVRDSGDLDGSSVVTLIGPNGSIETNGCILAHRHIHITSEQKKELDLDDVVSIKYGGEKGGILDNVKCKITPDAFIELHIDTDEANALGIKSKEEVEVIKNRY